MIFDQQALNQFYQYALSLCGAEADAYDLLQSGLEKYLKVQQKQTNHDKPKAYMRRIIRNLYIDQYRRQQTLSSDSFDENLHSGIQDISSNTLEKVMIDSNLLSSIWKQLNDNERELLYLWGLLGHTIDEIALELECPRGTLLARVHRLRKKLQSQNPKGATA